MFTKSIVVMHVTGLYTIPVINQNNITFIAFADTSVTALIHWLQLGAFTYCVFLYLVFSRILIFHEPLFSYQIKNSEYC